MKKLIILIFVFGLFLTGCTKKEESGDLLDKIKNEKTIKIGIKTDSKPFGYIENNEIKGFDIDIAYKLSEKIFQSDKKDFIKFVPLTPSERIMALNTGKVDILISTLSINERRKEIIDFSIPYYIAGQALLVRNGSKITSISQLNDKNIAVVLGTTGEKTARLFAPNANLIGALNYKEAFEKIKNNNVEAILADDSLLYGIILDNKGYKILPARYTKEYYAIGFRKEKQSATLKKVANSLLEQMQNDGQLNTIRKKWIPLNFLK